MAEFKVGEHTYKSRKLDPFVQLHIIKRAAPLMGPLMAINKGADKMSLLGSIPSILSKMSDEDIDYVVQSCLRVTRRLEVNVWADTWNEAAKQMMYQLNMIEIIQIVTYVVIDNVSSFFSALPELGNQAAEGLTTNQ